jgi:hypothetical protein
MGWASHWATFVQAHLDTLMYVDIAPSTYLHFVEAAFWRKKLAEAP